MSAGTDWLGLAHTALGFLSLGVAALVLWLPKGTRAHKRAGLAYAACMLGLNASAFGITDLFGGFGPFHVMAVISLATLLLGVASAWRRRPGWVRRHAYFMCWSVVGLVAAAGAEAATRIPGLDAGLPFGITAALCSALIIAVGGTLTHRRLPTVLQRAPRRSP